MPENKNKNQERLHVMPEKYYGLKPGVKPVSPSLPIQPVSQTKDKSRSSLIILAVVILVILIGFVGWFLFITYFSPPVQQVVEQTPAPVVNEETQEPQTTDEENIMQEEEEQVEEQEAEETVEFEPSDLSEKTIDEMATADSDNDGLTDSEELLLNTNINKPDTDEDGYLDGQEFVSLYNPLAKDPAQIEFSGFITTYVNPTYNYDVFYPNKWLAKALDKANVEVMFTSALGEFVSVAVIENEQQLSVKDWYLSQVADLTEDEIVEFTNTNNMSGIKSPDGFTVYFGRDNFIYYLHYNIGLKEEANYPNIFKMMVASFVFTGQ